jgi:hypothetical protein
MCFCQMSRWRNSKQNSLMTTKSESNGCLSIVNHLVRLIKTIWQLFEAGQGKKKVSLRAQAVDTSAQGRREKLPEWAIDQEAYLKKKALERANRQSKAPF